MFSVIESDRAPRLQDTGAWGERRLHGLHNRKVHACLTLSVHMQGVRCPASQLCPILVNFLSGQLLLGWKGYPKASTLP